jgi:hypothetical protein
MQNLENAVVELRVVLRLGDQLTGWNGLNRFVRVEAYERSGLAREMVIQPDDAGLFVVYLAPKRVIIPHLRRRGQLFPQGMPSGLATKLKRLGLPVQ